MLAQLFVDSKLFIFDSIFLDPWRIGTRISETRFLKDLVQIVMVIRVEKIEFGLYLCNKRKRM